MPVERIYKDIDFNLTIHPSTGDVLKVTDLDAIKASIRNLVLTEFYGRPFHPEIGSSVAGLLFENWTPLLDEAISTTIKDVIHSYEPRATIEDVQAEFDPSSNTYRITIELFLLALMQPATVELILKRVR